MRGVTTMARSTSPGISFTGGIAFLAQDFGIVRVDRIDLAPVAAISEVFHHVESFLAEVWVSSHNSYGLGFEEGLKLRNRIH